MKKTSTQASSICIIGNNAKAVAGAMALTYFGLSVTFYALSKSADEHVRRYQFDKTLCNQWQKSLDDGSLIYCTFDQAVLPSINFDTYWLFLDQMTDDVQQTVLDYLKYQSCDVCLSGIVQIGRIESIAEQLTSENVFYIPFVFLNDASIFLATIKPRLLLIGEKTEKTAKDNVVCRAFLEHTDNYCLHNLKTIEFTRSCMMNLMASKLSLINELARLADHCSVDMLEVESLLKLDNRLGVGFLKAGWGYGGSTLPKENEILKKHLLDLKLSANIVDEVVYINNDQKELIFRKLWQYFDSNIASKSIMIWGAGYKEGTGRTKGSAIHNVLPLLWGHNAITTVYDPLAKDELSEEYSSDERLKFTDFPYANLEHIDAIIIINWSEEYRPDISLINQNKTPIFDAKNLLRRVEIQQLEGYYTGIGRGIG
ncbi:UDP-glucose dehydrogenase [Psychrobacter nivimaris]|uniref:UDP-glucose 6-dehydrogenase n=1 Tax=Psychrobacter nivimaris TaxID=281738 RepID=A0A6N7C1Z5_9GAMM|nr:UDP binding domain-containing protein [Psychrobacter nivimaris]KAF0569373.1 UDP-glucose dehydrogenase [Psychrobacter nivimaris]